MKEKDKGTIVKKEIGGNIYYYHSISYRVKVNLSDKGKVKGTGKSKVVTKQVYLGTANDILEKFRE